MVVEGTRRSVMRIENDELAVTGRDENATPILGNVGGICSNISMILDDNRMWSGWLLLVPVIVTVPVPEINEYCRVQTG